VSRAMRELVEGGTIDVSRREITIRNADALRTMTGARQS